MNKLFGVAALIAASVASPSAAQDFSGARVAVEIGMNGNDFGSADDGTLGVVAGYDFDLGGAVLGVTAAVNDVFDDNDLGISEMSVGARYGAKITPSTLLYGSVAYSNLEAENARGDFDGLKVGLGLEQSFGRAFANIETRYGNYEAGAEMYQSVIGVGLRF